MRPRPIGPMGPMSPMSPMSPIGPIRLIRLIGLIGLMGLIGLTLTACSGDSDAEAPDYSTMNLLLGTPAFEENTRAVTLPDGYVSYLSLYPQAALSKSTIRVFMTTSSNTNSGVLTYKGDNKWTSNIPVAADTYYKIFGFMPREDAENATIAANHGTDADYTNGATLTITNLNAVTPADVCVIVGVAKTNKEGTDGTLSLGSFDYAGSSKEDGNYAYVLLDHLYAGLHFKMKVDATYNTLRTIKLKRLTLTANISSTTVNATIKLWTKAYASKLSGYDESAYDPVESAEFKANNEGTGSVATLYPANEGDGDLTLGTDYQTFLGCFAPGTCRNFTLTSTYDIYDRKGNLIRKDQTASNKISFATDLPRGKINTYNITVQPTYIYTLSEQDLDNPEVVLTASQ